VKDDQSPVWDSEKTAALRQRSPQVGESVKPKRVIVEAVSARIEFRTKVAAYCWFAAAALLAISFICVCVAGAIWIMSLSR